MKMKKMKMSVETINNRTNQIQDRTAGISNKPLFKHTTTLQINTIKPFRI